MHPKPAHPARALAGLVMAALLPAWLAACGGTDSEPGDVTADGRARPTEVQTVTPPLLDDEGRPVAAVPAAVPADPAARTRHRRYATEVQAAMLEERFGVLAIPVTVEPGADAAAAMELATLMVFGHQAVHDLSPDAPVLVRGRDLRLAAATVHQLEAIGFTRVFLVTR